MPEREINLRDFIRVIVKWRRIIVFNTLIITLLAVIISLILPKRYTATATLIPPVEQQPSVMGLSAILGGGSAGALGSFGRLSGLPGMATPSDLFARILGSRVVMEGVIETCDLMNVYETEEIEISILALEGATHIEVSPEGVISISTDAKSAQLSADIANAYVKHLDHFNREATMTQGKKNRIFIEKRLKEVEKDVKEAEEELKAFQEKFKTVSLEDEVLKAIEAAADLKAQIILKDVELGVMRGFATAKNPQVIRLKSEMTQLQKQLKRMEEGSKEESSASYGAGFSIPFSDLPEVGLQLARLMREAKIQETVFTLLTEQYEQAKIMEVRDTPTVQILDIAKPPFKKSFPKRSRIVIIAFLFSLFAGIGITFFMEYLDKMQEHPEEVSDWKRMGLAVRRDFEILISHLLRKRRSNQK
jgi:uncharacterized protein involved in exopolysaccharide biosynthesis